MATLTLSVKHRLHDEVYRNLLMDDFTEEGATLFVSMLYLLEDVARDTMFTIFSDEFYLQQFRITYNRRVEINKIAGENTLLNVLSLLPYTVDTCPFTVIPVSSMQNIIKKEEPVFWYNIKIVFDWVMESMAWSEIKTHNELAKRLHTAPNILHQFLTNTFADFKNKVNSHYLRNAIRAFLLNFLEQMRACGQLTKKLYQHYND